MLKLWELCKKALPGFGKQEKARRVSPEEHKSTPAKQQGAKAAASSKSKKNKPMSASEQEAKIARLKEIQGLYQGQDASDAPPQEHSAVQDTSDDSSEED